MSDPHLKLGKLAAVRPAGLSYLSAYAAGKLPAPPPEVAPPPPPPGGWGMLGNDQFGDCTIAGAAHLDMAWNTDTDLHDHVPSVQETVDTYFAITNGQDTGCNEHAVLQRWRSLGLFGEKIAAYAPVRLGDIIGLHQAIALYGGAYLGVALPASAQDQFRDGQTWTVVPGSPIEGGHCIVAVGYTPGAVAIVTWGKIVWVTYPWLAAYCDEVWAILSAQAKEKGTESGIDFPSLLADLDRL